MGLQTNNQLMETQGLTPKSPLALPPASSQRLSSVSEQDLVLEQRRAKEMMLV